MKKPLSFSWLVLTLSAGALRSQSDNSLEKWGVLEFDYRIQVNKWAFVQPFPQYVIRPNGTGLVQNATVLGLHFGVEF